MGCVDAYRHTDLQPSPHGCRAGSRSTEALLTHSSYTTTGDTTACVGMPRTATSSGQSNSDRKIIARLFPSSQRHGRPVAILTQSRRRADDASIHHCGRDRRWVGSSLGGAAAACGLRAAMNTHPINQIATGDPRATALRQMTPEQLLHLGTRQVVYLRSGIYVCARLLWRSGGSKWPVRVELYPPPHRGWGSGQSGR